MEDKMTGFYVGEVKVKGSLINPVQITVLTEPNPLVFGKSGAGMSFGAKKELTERLLKENNKRKPISSK